jgi:tetratricopeptide (TPR) repeat protein
MSRAPRLARRTTALLLAALLAWGAAACSLPRITLNSDPLSLAEHLKLGLAYESGGDLPAALREYQAAMGKEPLARLFTGNVLFAQGRLDEAEAAYRQALRDLPSDPEPRNNLAWLLFTQRERLDEAEALAQEALRLSPPDRAAVFQDTLDQIRAARAQSNP